MSMPERIYTGATAAFMGELFTPSGWWGVAGSEPVLRFLRGGAEVARYGGAIINPDSGKFQIIIDADETALLTEGTYGYELLVIREASEETYLLESGTIDVISRVV